MQRSNDEWRDKDNKRLILDPGPSLLRNLSNVWNEISTLQVYNNEELSSLEWVEMYLLKGSLHRRVLGYYIRKLNSYLKKSD